MEEFQQTIAPVVSQSDSVGLLTFISVKARKQEILQHNRTSV